MAFRDFTDMPVWQLANEIVGDIYTLTTSLPKTEEYELKSQLRQAAISITSNIAEGFGRSHSKEKKHFYLYSRGSCHEVRSHLFCGQGIGYFSESEIVSISEKCKKVVEELNRIMSRLQ